MTLRFTKRQRLILKRLCEGYEVKAIAAELEIAEGTARTHVRNLVRKAGVVSDLQLVLYVMQQPQSLIQGQNCQPGLHLHGACPDSWCPYCRAMSFGTAA